MTTDLVAQTVALTFDDAPDPTNTARVLDALRDAGVKATFFVNTHNQARRPERPPLEKPLLHSRAPRKQALVNMHNQA
jgi:peptidoglycan/xylan/chitin deacetylase (PgdA/CDA1 family)